MGNLSTKYVPSEGNENAKIIIVGEAPGEDETRASRPFVGKSGQFLERYLGRAGISRSEVFLTNLCHYQPNGNRFEYCIDTPELKAGLEELRNDIRRIKPNLILTVGAWPMYFLTGKVADAKQAKPGSGITTWRGSVLPCSLVDNYKVLVTYHPAYIIRPEGFHLHPVFQHDIKKAAIQATFADIKYPKYDEIIDPSQDILDNLLDAMACATYLSIDIETFGDSMACFGVADSRDRGTCLTYKHPNRNWEAARAILAMNTPKIFQFGGGFDINYLKHHYGWDTKNYYWDTYVAQNNLFPGFEKTLAFQTSIYTDFPYYKEDRKIWKESGNLETLWKYNVKDCIATYIIAETQMKEVAEKWG